jgi:predicted nucleotidyltransferase
MSIIDRHIDKIHDLCNRHRVAHLFAFGSVLTDNFRPDSDIDFIVDFSDVQLFEYADNYFGLKHSLENLLNRNIDLLEDKAIKNPFLRKSIDASKKLIYGK